MFGKKQARKLTDVSTTDVAGGRFGTEEQARGRNREETCVEITSSTYGAARPLTSLEFKQLVRFTGPTVAECTAGLYEYMNE